MFRFLFILVVLSILSCNKIDKNPKIVAKIDEEEIYLEEIDKLIEQELYGALFRIYYLRKISLEELIDERILDKEAQKLNIDRRYFTKYIIDQYYSKEALNNFVNEYKLDYFGLPDLKNPVLYHKIDSKEGKQLLDKAFKEKIRKRYLDSLKQYYDIQIFLEPVNPPKQTLNNVTVHYRAKLESKVTVLILSDFECTVCREASSVYNKIYRKYKNYVKFGFIHFSRDVTLASLACESAGRQGKFWEMHDSILSTNTFIDSLGYFELAEKIELNLTQFKKDLRDTLIYNNIKNTIEILKEKKFYGTPTVVINGRIIMNSFSSEEIEKVINEELNK